MRCVAPNWARDGIPSVVGDDIDLGSYPSDRNGRDDRADATTSAVLRFEGGQTVTIAGTRFEVAAPDGGVLPQQALVGAVLAVETPAGGRAEIRIDAVIADPQDPRGDVTLYALSSREENGEWHAFCSPGLDGLALGFPVTGIWTDRGEHLRADAEFSLTCTSGAIGKCVRMGYRYCETRADGAPMWELHQACTRMLRADYCGDGGSHTRDGTVVNVYDRFGIQRPDPEPSRFEAAWSADGAVCVQRTRVPDVMDLDALSRACPERVPPEGAMACDDTDALLANRS
jgi:hypothetical protein